MSTKIQTQMDNFISHCIHTKGLRPSTVQSYRDVFRHFRTILPDIERVEQLNYQVVDDFFLRLRHRPKKRGAVVVETGLKASTLRTYGVKLHTFFSWLCERGHLKTNPVIKSRLPKIDYTDNRALSKDEVEKIIGAVAQSSHNLFLYKRDMALVQVLLFCGLRKNELLSLRVMDVDLSNLVVTVNGATSKSRFTRKLPITPTTAMYLSEYVSARQQAGCNEAALWMSTRGQPLTAHGLKHWVDKLRAQSGVHFHLHRFRHTFACMLGRSDVSAVKIQHLMGHRDLRMTQTYLRSLGVEDTRDSVQRLSLDWL